MKTNWTKYKKVIFGIKGLTLSQEEINFFVNNKPVGFIIFKRNIESLDQLKNLVTALKHLNENNDTPILIDQEGGRVARLRPPLSEREYPPAKIFGDMALTDLDKAKKAVFDNYYLIGLELINLGININCAPVADLTITGAHSVIGDRSFSEDPNIVIELCKKCDQGLKAAKVQSIIKHLPGHGRALSDSHLSLPIVSESLEVLEKTDFAVFKKLVGINWAMTAHIIYEAIDPDKPATQSKKVIDYIRNEINFKNIIITDDLSMKALKGSFSSRANESLAAGCDLVLHCNGNLDEMIEVAKGTDFIDIELAIKFEEYLNDLREPIKEEL